MTTSPGFRWVKRIFIGLVILVVIATVGLWLWAKPARPDAFYRRPESLPASPGKLIRAEAYTQSVPPGAIGWRILYSTTDINDRAIVASAIVVAPQQEAGTPRAIIAWNHGTTGFAPGCAPSLLNSPQPLGPIPSLETVIREGWVVVATDYAGLGTDSPHPYLIGEGEARSSLDAIRAALTFDQLKLENKTVVWGHSQGGGATLWTGILAPSYAPELNIVGIAGLAPATDIPALVEKAKDTPVGKIIVSFIMNAYSQTYPDVRYDEYISGWRATFVKDIGNRCLDGKETLFSVGEVLTVLSGPVFTSDPLQGSLATRLRENIPNGPIAAPVLIAQGQTDELVYPEIQQAFVDRRCAEGQSIEYQTYKGRDHMAVVAPDSPLQANLLNWTRERMSGNIASAGCARQDF